MISTYRPYIRQRARSQEDGAGAAASELLRLDLFESAVQIQVVPGWTCCRTLVRLA